MLFYLFASKKNGVKNTFILFRSWFVRCYLQWWRIGKVEKNCDENHLVNLFVFEHLDFGVKGELEAKLICSNTYVISGIYSNFHCFFFFLVCYIRFVDNVQIHQNQSCTYKLQGMGFSKIKWWLCLKIYS
jgi:hypothetical protein